MKTTLPFCLSIILFMCISLPVKSQVPQGFNYQAVVRDESGTGISDVAMPVRVAILSGGTVIWEEEHRITTNEFGLMVLTIGDPLAERIGGKVAAFNLIDWSEPGLSLGTKVYFKGVWKDMGSSKLWAVPYSLTSGSLNGVLKKLSVAGETTNQEEALFEVKNNLGQTVFAVYNEGVRVYIDNGESKGVKGGFAIGGLGTAKAPGEEYFRVTRDSTRVKVNEAAKGVKGGFAIGGLGTAKAGTDNFLNLTKENYFIGHNSGQYVTTGLNNSFIGYESGKYNTTGSSNAFMGYNSGNSNTSGSQNVFVGRLSGFSNTTGKRNVFVGDSTGYRNSTASNNVFIGKKAGAMNTIGYDNVYLGTEAGYNTQTGDANVFIGYQSGFSNLYANYNAFLGYQAGYTNRTGNENVFMGYQAGLSNYDGMRNVFIGYVAGQSNTSGTYNIFVGREAGKSNTTGTSNVFIGESSGASLVDGSINTFVGKSTGGLQTTGGYNVYLGGQAAIYKPSGSYNTFLGYHSGARANGDANILIGFQAGSGYIGGNNILIGYQAGNLLPDATTNKLMIENSSSNIPLIGGDFSTNRVGINRMPLTYTFEVEGAIWASGNAYAANYFSSSDARYKNDIIPLENALSSILKIQGVRYNFNSALFPDLNFPAGEQIGVIAQEVEKVLPELVFTGTDGYKSVSYEKLTPVLVEAVKEQQKVIEGQNAEIEALKARLQKIEELLDKK